MSGKQLPPPGGGNDIEALLRRRRVNTGDEEPPAPPPAEPDPPRPAGRPRGSGMDRRSWYMPKRTADALADEVEDLHYATRQPKHVVLRELIAVALEHRAEVERRLKGQS